MYKEYDFDTFYKTVVFEGNSIIELTELLNILTSPEPSLTPNSPKFFIPLICPNISTDKYHPSFKPKYFSKTSLASQ